MVRGTHVPLAIAQMIETGGRGGAETLAFDLCSELRARGHSVVPVGPVDGEAWLSRRLQEAGFEPGRFRLRRALDPSALREIVGELRRARVDVVHSHEFTCAVYGTAATRWLGVPHVITMHGDVAVTDVWRRRAALRWAFRHSAATCFVSEATRRRMEERLGSLRARVSVIHNGVHPFPKGDGAKGDGGAIRAELGMRESELLVLCVGNLHPVKGHRVLIESLARLAACGEGPGWTLAIAGAGPEAEALSALARRRAIADRVHLLGPRSDVPSLLAAADLFALPSHREGLPLALLEAMLAGKPIVASAVGGIPEAIRPGEHGVLVPAGEVEPLAEALGSLLADPGERARLGEAARARAEREFTLNEMVDRYERSYRAALDR